MISLLQKSVFRAGNCVSVCPLGSISLVDGKPKWESNCTKCLACINRCPEEAIQSGKATTGRDVTILKRAIIKRELPQRDLPLKSTYTAVCQEHLPGSSFRLYI
jgi:MinD superfamily P-loop ATPase